MRQQVAATLIIAAVRGKLTRMRARRKGTGTMYSTKCISSDKTSQQDALEESLSGPMKRRGCGGTASATAAMAKPTAADGQRQQALVHLRPLTPSFELTENPLHYSDNSGSLGGLRYHGDNGGVSVSESGRHSQQSRLRYRKAAALRLAQAMANFADQLGQEIAATGSNSGRGGALQAPGQLDYGTMV